MMNEAINKSWLSQKDTSVHPRNSYKTAGAQLVAEETGIKSVRKEIENIPVNGLLTNKLLARLPDEEFARLLPYLEPISLKAGDYIYAPEDVIDFSYFLESAVVSQMHLLADGNTAEVALVGNEGMIGLSAIFDKPATPYWTQIIISGSAIRIRTEDFRKEFNRGQALQRQLLAYTSERLAHLSQRAVCNGRHTLPGRLCTWLLMVQERARRSRLTLTHEEIARHLGIRRAGITVAATYLRERQIIEYSRGHIRILDRQALEDSACECYQMLTLQAEQDQKRSDTRNVRSFEAYK